MVSLTRRAVALFVRAAQYAGLMTVNPWWSNYWGPIQESFTQAWQKNVTVVSDKPALLSSSAVYACVGGIAGDIAKMPLNLVDKNDDGIWEPTENNAYSPVLRDPNHYQTSYKFIEQWIVSKLLYGNTYVLKERDNRGGENRGNVTALYILHPLCVNPLVGEDGSVYYKVKRDYLSQLDDGDSRSVSSEDLLIPASEVIHDMMVSLWHPLVGVSPLFAAATSATMQSKIQTNSMNLFGNRSMPGGVLSVPGDMSETDAMAMKSRFESLYGGQNYGKVAVLTNGTTFSQIAMTAEHAQLIEQLDYTVKDVARSFHYPMFKLGGDYPTYDSVDALNVLYYSDCLQPLVISLEKCLEKGLGLDGVTRGIELDIDALLWMDPAKLYATLDTAKNILTPNEQRFRAGYAPAAGGNAVYRQQQDYSIEALAKRDAKEDPFASGTTEPKADPQEPKPNPPQSTTEPAEDRGFSENDWHRYYRGGFSQQLVI